MIKRHLIDLQRPKMFQNIVLTSMLWSLHTRPPNHIIQTACMIKELGMKEDRSIIRRTNSLKEHNSKSNLTRKPKSMTILV